MQRKRPDNSNYIMAQHILCNKKINRYLYGQIMTQNFKLTMITNLNDLRKREVQNKILLLLFNQKQTNISSKGLMDV